MLSVNDITITSLDIITAYSLAGVPRFILDELSDAQISNTQEKEDITGSFNSLKEVINNTFDFSVAKGELAALKEEIDTLGTGLDEVQRSINRVRNASIAADEKAAMPVVTRCLAECYIGQSSVGLLCA